MVNRRASHAAAPALPAPAPAPAPPPPPPQQQQPPIAKRKRRASCLGEQERRERKRAIDREAQRSLREKTKTHIAELERTIDILRARDGNAVAASLLAEIEGLRAENERLRDIIEGVRGVVGGEVQAQGRGRAVVGGVVSGGRGENGEASGGGRSVDQISPPSRSASSSKENRRSPRVLDDQQPTTFFDQSAVVARRLDLDGMTVMSDADADADAPVTADGNAGMDMMFSPLTESPDEGEEQEEGDGNGQGVEELPWDDAPATATWAPMMEEIFGPNWRCPSPTILHIGNPDNPSSSPSGAMCPIWIKSNELFGRVFSYASRKASTSTSTSTSITVSSPAYSTRTHLNTSTSTLTTHPAPTPAPEPAPAPAPVAASAFSEKEEAGLLYQGIAHGWDALDGTWQHHPALSILQQIDALLFCHLPRIERLAVAYKSFKLLKYYLNAGKRELDRVPEWLRPSFSQASTSHPIAVDFFAWPTLRSRLLHAHATICATSALSCCYSRYLRFDWPFAFEDAFFCEDGGGDDDDEFADSSGGGGGGREDGGREGAREEDGQTKKKTKSYYPSPLFERYHSDLRYWRVDDMFYETFPEMRGDIEGDRRRGRDGG